MSILYATFEDAADAEKAAGALFDYGVARRDLTITSKFTSRIRSKSVEDETAQLNGESEGWPSRSTDIMTAERRMLEEDEDQASVSYREADDAERSAKNGISVTTPRDAASGALKGSVAGFCLGVLAGIVWISSLHAGFIISGAGITFAMEAAGIGLAAGAIVGAATGFLKDQGTSREVRSRNTPRLRSRPVLLAVNISSGDHMETEARRLVSKYHASSIDTS